MPCAASRATGCSISLPDSERFTPHSSPLSSDAARPARMRTPRRGEAPQDGEGSTPEIKDRSHEAALRLFAEKGFHAVSVRDICLNARTPLPMVYCYYGSKKGLHDALLEESVERRTS